MKEEIKSKPKNSPAFQNMTEVILDRSVIAGIIDEKTPLVVLKEILDAETIQYESNRLYDVEYRSFLRSTIRGRVPARINMMNIRDQDWGRICKFVSPGIHRTIWGTRSDLLLRGLGFLLSFINSSEEIDPNFSVGPISPSNLKSYDATILYRLLRARGIETRLNLDIIEMGRILRQCLEPEGVLQGRALSLIRHGGLSVSQLAHLLGGNIQISDHEEIGSESYVDAHNLIGNVREMARRIKPLNNIEAITFAANKYGINLRETSNPLHEYYRIQSDGDFYVPLDAELARKEKLSPGYMDLRKTFDPILDPIHYKLEYLRELTRRSGVDPRSFPDAEKYELLQIQCLNPMFYEGLIEPYDAETAVYGTPVTELDPSNLVCFGTRYDIPKKVFTFTELAEAFTNNKNYNNPASERNIQFEETNIKQLNVILETEGEFRDQLREAIRLVEEVRRDVSLRRDQFREEYEQLPAIRQGVVDRALNIIFRTSLYMRGYRDTDINYDAAYIGVDVQPEDSERLALESLHELLQLRDFHIEDVNLVLHLPLVKYRYPAERPGDNINLYEMSTEVSKGKTIEDRIKIVMHDRLNTGSLENTNSCIRMSSTWLLSSAICYITALGKNVGTFDIHRIRDIQ